MEGMSSPSDTGWNTKEVFLTPVWAGWLSLSLSIAIIFVFCTTYTLCLLKRRRSFTRRSASDKCTAVVSIMSLTIVLTSAALVPVDVFAVSYMKNPDGSFKDWASDPAYRHEVTGHLMASYFVVYAVTFVMTFLVLPLTFFYNALGDGIDFNDDTHDSIEAEDQAALAEISFTRRMGRAFKYTLASLFLCGLLVLLGIFLPVQNSPKAGHWYNGNGNVALDAVVADFNTYGNHTSGGIEDKAKNLFVFLINVLNIVGMILMVIYTSYGMSVLPTTMIAGSDTVHSECNAVNREMSRIESQINDMKEEFPSESMMTEFDLARLDRLERELRILARTRHQLEQSAKSFLNRLILLLRPFQLVFGAFFTLFGFLIFLSLLLTSIDKALNSYGPKTGYTLVNATLPNPVDMVLVLAQRAFPLDYIVYSGMVLFFLLSSLSGIQEIGIRFVWISVYKIGCGKTRPQALILMCLTLTFLTLATNVVMFSVVPDYTAYGSQRYLAKDNTTGANTTMECNHLEAPVNDCVMTRAAVLILAFNYKIWIFGAAYYWAVWLLLGAVVVGAFVATIKMRRPGTTLSPDRQQLMENDEPSIFNTN